MSKNMACCALAALVMSGWGGRMLPAQEQPRKTLGDLVNENEDPVEFVGKLLREGIESCPEAYEAVGGAAAPDPNGSMGQSGVIMYLVDFLVDHWQDPRSEKILEEVAQAGKRSICGDMGPTRHGLAYGALFRLSAKQLLDKLVADKHEPKERLQAIRDYLYSHPKRLPPGVYEERDDAGEDVPSFPEPFGEELSRSTVARGFRIAVMRELGSAAREWGAADAIDVVARTGMWTMDYVNKYAKEVLAFADTLNIKKAVAMPDLVSGISRWIQDEQAVTLLQKWLAETDDEKVMESLVIKISIHSKGGRHKLLSLLDDHRVVVARTAAACLQNSADQEVLDALRRTSASWRARGVDQQNMSSLEWVMKLVEAKLENKRKEQ